MSVVRVFSYVWERLRKLFDARRSTHAKSEVAVFSFGASTAPCHLCTCSASGERRGRFHALFTNAHTPAVVLVSAKNRLAVWRDYRFRPLSPPSPYNRRLGAYCTPFRLLSWVQFHHSCSQQGAKFSGAMRAVLLERHIGTIVSRHNQGTPTSLVRVCSLCGFADRASTLYSTYPKPVSLLPLSPCRSASTASGTWR